MIIPDTIEGSILLSVIDFILSFFIIWGIGLVLYLFPLLSKIGSVDEEKLKGGQ